MSKVHCIECKYFTLPGNRKYKVLEVGAGFCLKNKGQYKGGTVTTLFSSCGEGKLGANDYERLKTERESETKKRCAG